MIDLHDPKRRGRLLDAIKGSRVALRPFRVVREKLLKDYAGSWYSEKGHGKNTKILVNLMNQTAKIYTVALAANNPVVDVATMRPSSWPFAKRFELNLNKLISDMNLAKTFRQIVLDAFFSIGIAVVCMRDTDTRFHGLLEGEEDVFIDPGEPWLNRVSIDDAILDMATKDLSKMRYCGHMYRADYEKVMDEPGYAKDVKAQLKPSKRDTIEGDGPRGWDLGTDVEDDRLKDLVWLQDVWIPENGSVATMAACQDLPPLLERDWTGGQSGPYKFLSLGLMPDCIMPSSPASNLKCLHDLQNRLHRKMERQSDRQKTVNVYQVGDEDDATKLRDAKDGEWKGLRNPRDVQQVSLGGIDAGNQAWSMIVQDEYNRAAGNIGARAGLGPQAPTARQEGIIQDRVDSQDADMHMSVLTFAGECCEELGRLMWHDENLEVRTSRQVEGTNITVDSSWPLRNEWGDRIVDGEFDDYELKVQALSMVYKSPEQKVQEILGTVSELAPLYPMFEATGGTLDIKELLAIIAKLRNQPELNRIYKFVGQVEMTGSQNTVRQSPVTRRETIRRNVPTGGTQENRGALMAQVLGQGAMNADQMGSLTRGAG